MPFPYNEVDDCFLQTQSFHSVANESRDSKLRNEMNSWIHLRRVRKDEQRDQEHVGKPTVTAALEMREFTHCRMTSGTAE